MTQETIYCERAGWRREYFTYCERVRVFIGPAQVRLMERQGARIVTVGSGVGSLAGGEAARRAGQGGRNYGRSF